MPTNVTAPRPCSPRSMLPLAWSRPAIISAAGASSYLDFMNRVVAEHAGREIHVILDNLNTDKPKHDRWLTRHKNVHFHFTPTHASWLNQVEVWFSILSAKPWLVRVLPRHARFAIRSMPSSRPITNRSSL